MKMHPKPAIRHTKHVEPFIVDARYESNSTENFRLHFCRIQDDATAVLTMTENEAKSIMEQIALTIKFGGLKASDIETEDWSDFHHKLKQLFL